MTSLLYTVVQIKTIALFILFVIVSTKILLSFFSLPFLRGWGGGAGGVRKSGSRVDLYKELCLVYTELKAT